MGVWEGAGVGVKFPPPQCPQFESVGEDSGGMEPSQLPLQLPLQLPSQLPSQLPKLISGIIVLQLFRVWSRPYSCYLCITNHSLSIGDYNSRVGSVTLTILVFRCRFLQVADNLATCSYLLATCSYLLLLIGSLHVRVSYQLLPACT